MKRSEMVFRMLDEIESWYLDKDDFTSSKCFTNLANMLLTLQEESGMLPPKSLDTVCLKQGLVRGYSTFFEWEEE